LNDQLYVEGGRRRRELSYQWLLEQFGPFPDFVVLVGEIGGDGMKVSIRGLEA
jgi:hypothetical protein